MRTAEVTKLRRSNKRNKMKRTQSIHPEITRTIEFNTLTGTPKGSDQLGGGNVDTKKKLKICFDCTR
jgi:hypothetical protein